MSILFCRLPAPDTIAEAERNRRKRVAEADDPVALRELGSYRCDEGDYKRAFEYWTKAATLGDVLAHYQLSVVYYTGKGVGMDEQQRVYHLEQVAIGGTPEALQNGRYERATKHFIIAAKLGLGESKSMTPLKKAYGRGSSVEKTYPLLWDGGFRGFH